MPRMTWFSWIIWIVAIVAETGLAISMRIRPFWRRWPSVFSFLVLSAAVSLALLTIRLSGIPEAFKNPIYFYLYWLGTGLSSAVQIWMIIEIGCSLAGASRKVRRWIWFSIPTLALLYLAGSLWFSLKAPSALVWKLTGILFGLNRAISIAWIATFLCVSLLCDVLGIRWNRQALYIAIGFALHAMGEVAVSWATAVFANLGALSNIHALIFLLALTFWGMASIAKEPHTEPLPSIESLRSVIDFYRLTLSRIRSR